MDEFLSIIIEIAISGTVDISDSEHKNARRIVLFLAFLISGLFYWFAYISKDSPEIRLSSIFFGTFVLSFVVSSLSKKAKNKKDL